MTLDRGLAPSTKPIGPFDLGGTVTTQYGAPTFGHPDVPHPGVDIGGLPIGTQIPAFVAGKVSRIFRDAIGGIQVEVTTPQGFRQIYAHLAAVNVRADQQVSGSDIIGFLGNTGQVSGPHLHYEVRKPSGETIDPSLFLSEFLGSTTTPGYQYGGGPSGLPGGLSPSQIQQIRDRVIGYNADIFLGQMTAGEAATRLRSDFPNVPVNVLQQIAYGLASDISGEFTSAINTIPGGTVVDKFLTSKSGASQFLSDLGLTSQNALPRLGLTLLAAGLIIGGVMLYARPSGVLKLAHA